MIDYILVDLFVDPMLRYLYFSINEWVQGNIDPINMSLAFLISYSMSEHHAILIFGGSPIILPIKVIHGSLRHIFIAFAKRFHTNKHLDFSLVTSNMLLEHQTYYGSCLVATKSHFPTNILL